MTKKSIQRGEYGLGTVYQRKDRPGWIAALWVTDASGKSVRRTRSADTYPAARSKLKELRDERDAGVTASTNPTLAEYLTDWLASVKPTLRPRVYGGYESMVRVRIGPRLGKKKLSKVRALDIQKLYADLSASGLSNRSIHNTHTMLKKAMKQAVDWGLLMRNPAAGATPPRPEPAPIHPLTEEEVTRLLDYTEQAPHWYHRLLVLAVTTGMREGELLGLRWRDVDLDAAQLHVAQQMTYEPGVGKHAAEPKTKPSRRTIHLSAMAVTALRAQRTQLLELRLALGPDWPGHDDLVFLNSHGTPIYGSEMRKIFGRLTKRLGLPDVRFHDLRHTCATLLLSRGVHPKVVSEMLGHSSIAITLDIYSHYIPAMHQQAAAEMDALLG